MDFLELNQGSSSYKLDYGLPRLFHVRTSDFKFVTQFDLLETAGNVGFGRLAVSISPLYFIIVILITFLSAL